MKYLLALFLLTSATSYGRCNDDANPAINHTRLREYRVQELFRIGKISVFRFCDHGRPHYFSLEREPSCERAGPIFLDEEEVSMYRM